MSKKQTAKTKSKSKLAATLGVARSTLYEWQAHGAPIEKGEGAVVEWAMSEGRRGKDSDEMRAAKLGVLHETARRLKIANDQKSGALVSLDAVRMEAAEAMGIVFRTLEHAAHFLPHNCEGLPPIQLRRQIELQFKNIETTIRAAFKKMEGDDAAASAEFQRGAERVEWAIRRENSLRTFEERIESDYLRFRDWLKEVHEIQSEKRVEWCRLRAAAKLGVPNATDEEMQIYGVRRRTEDYAPKNFGPTTGPDDGAKDGPNPNTQNT